MPLRLPLRALLPLFLFTACATGPRWHGAPSRARAALTRGDAIAMGRAVADTFARFNLPIEVPPDLARRARYAEDRIATALAGRAVRADPRARALLLFVVARRIAEEVVREHAPPQLAPAAAARLRDDLARAALVELCTADAELRAQVAAAAVLATEHPATAPPLPTTAREIAQRMRQKGEPLALALAKVFSSSFDRATIRVLRGLPNVRACTLRTVDAPLAAESAAVSRDGRLFLVVPGALREIPPKGPELRRALPMTLGPGALLHAPYSPKPTAPPLFELWHLRKSPAQLEARALRLSPEAAAFAGSVVLRGGDLLADAGVEWAGAIPVLLIGRRAFPGLRETAVRLDTRRPQKGADLPGGPGYRDGRLGEARFTMGPSAVTPEGARVFYDPVARALRVLYRGSVATLADAPRRDGVGGSAGVGAILAIAAAPDGRLYLAERGREEGGFRRFHLRLVDPKGGPCP